MERTHWWLLRNSCLSRRNEQIGLKSSHWSCSIKIAVLKNFAKLTGLYKYVNIARRSVLKKILALKNYKKLCRDSLLQMFFKKDVLKNFANLTWKYLYWSLFLKNCQPEGLNSDWSVSIYIGTFPLSNKQGQKIQFDRTEKTRY